VSCYLRRSRSRLGGEAGSILLETLIGAVLVAIMAIAFFGALDGSARVSSISKLRAEAASLAQDDQERLRSMPVTALNNLRESNTRTVAGVNFQVDSRADWIADSAQATTCVQNGAAADYLKITTTVTPTSTTQLKPVVVTSTVTPPPGSFAGKGSLAVTVVDRAGNGIPGMTVNLSGPATDSEITDQNGCAFFGYEPAGTTYTVSTTRAGYVDPDGKPSASAGVTINDQQTATQQLQYDLAGKATITFVSKPRDQNGTQLTAEAPSSQWFLTMSNGSHTQTFGPASPSNYPTGWPYTSPAAVSAITTTATLFPFASPYTVYAGDCTKMNPANNGVTDPGLQVDPGQLNLTYKQQLPALNVLVKRNGSALANANVTFALNTALTTSKSYGCTPFTVGRTTNASGILDDPGLPYGTYDVCADDGTRRVRLAAVDNASLPGTNQITLNVPTSGGTGLKCP
jgi:Tfp pilus assembly protein PilV